MDVAGGRLIGVGREFYHLERYELAIEILLPLAESGMIQAYAALADNYYYTYCSSSSSSSSPIAK